MSCSNVAAELGVDHAWLPVTWTREIVPPVGTWFYYMPGCSDFAWNVGHTLLVRNRFHAAVVLQQHLHPQDSWQEAVRRVARHIALHPWREVERARVRLSTVLARNITLDDLVHETALGIFDNKGSGCVGVLSSEPKLPRARALSALVGSKFLDAHNERVARSLPQSRRLDTVQFSEQTQGGAHALRWFVEVWDIRDHPGGRHGRPHAFQRGNGLFGWPNGTACELASRSHLCAACSGSQNVELCWPPRCPGGGSAVDRVWYNF